MSKHEWRSDFSLVERWHSDAFENKEIAKKIFLDTKQKLRIFPHPFSGWRSFPNQNLETIKINENGLRSKSLKNLRFKKNAIILGASVAWGFGASSNEYTPAYLIEDILHEKYNIEFNVINLAEQAYTSFEELKSFMCSADDLKPDLLICLTGSNDIYREYINGYKVNDAYKKFLNFFTWGQKLGIIEEKSQIKRIIKYLIRGGKSFSKLSDEYYMFDKPSKNKLAASLFQNKLDWINSYCKSKKIPVAYFLQPDLHFKKFKSETEKNYLNYYYKEERSKFILKKFEEFKLNFFKKNETENIFYSSLLDIFDDNKNTIFFDKAHMTNKGYKIMSNIICEKIVKNLL